VIAALTFNELMAGFLRHAKRPVADEPEVVAYDDPQRDPNYCWTHNMIWPACAGMH